jgi:microcystin-dependent protein
MTVRKPIVYDGAGNLQQLQAGDSINIGFDGTVGNIKMDGVAAVGSSGIAPNSDHVHPVDTSRAPLASPTFTGGVTNPSWATGTVYTALQMVLNNNTAWVCLTNHTSGTFLTDWLTNGYWAPLGDGSGMIKMWGAAAVPSAYYLCDGSLKNRTTDATLFGVIGATFGAGDGSTTFQLPDFGGISPIGASVGVHLKDKNNTGNYFLGVLGTYYQDIMFGHYHSPISGINNILSYVATGGNVAIVGGTSVQGYTTTGVPASDGSNGTPNYGAKTQGPGLGINFIIKR